MTLAETTWRGAPALKLENDRLRIVTTPGVGAKITSVYDKCAAHEWLIAPPQRSFGPVRYGASFTAQDMSGWDEMYPTIKACAYPVAGCLVGKPLPDHGEVWALPWQVETLTDDALTLSVNGRALPYRLCRTMALHDTARMILRYEVVNTGSQPLAALWAAHPQFAVTSQTCIRLPHVVTELYNVHDSSMWGTQGRRYSWPEAVNQHGDRVRLDRIAPATATSSRKLYVPPEIAIEWAALVQEDADHWLLLQWQSCQLPYFGIWIDEGGVNSVATAALEVTDGFYDSLVTAWEHQRCPIISPGERRQWQVTLQVGDGPLHVN